MGAEIRTGRPLFSPEESLNELTLLAQTAGIDVVGHIIQRLSQINPATFIGAGKLGEIADMLPELGADMLIFDDELSPRHQREIEKILGEKTRVLDRSALILDIFAQHANTREGALQVELAQYEYRLPRLTRQWTHLARQAGGGSARGGSGGVGLRGPGETQLEVDRREIRKRISKLKEELEAVRAHRQRHRQQRIRTGMPMVSLVGYTNAGKSTLINALSGSDVYVANQLFATLDPTTRRVELPNGRLVLISDTVGFIQKLPVTLVAAFRATLEEVIESDLLLHVVDGSHPLAWDHVDVVEDTLAQLEANRIPKILVLNKTDLGEKHDISLFSQLGYKEIVSVSAREGTGLDALLAAISRVLAEEMIEISVFVPYTQGDILAMLHHLGTVIEETPTEEGVQVTARVSPRLAGNLKDVIHEGSEN